MHRDRGEGGSGAEVVCTVMDVEINDSNAADNIAVDRETIGGADGGVGQHTEAR